MVGARGFEPPTPCSRSRCATRLRYAPTVTGQVAGGGGDCKRLAARWRGKIAVPSSAMAGRTRRVVTQGRPTLRGGVRLRRWPARRPGGHPREVDPPGRTTGRPPNVDPPGAIAGRVRRRQAAASAATIRSPISAVETGVPPSGPIRSAVRTPSASTFSTAASSASAAAPSLNE